MKNILLSIAAILVLTGPAEAAVQAPALKWAYGGCYSSWCETGWYSSPAVADLDGNGTMEIVASAYSIAALKGNTGEVIWRVDSGKDRNSPPGYSHRTWPGIWIKDIDGDNHLEIITAHSGGIVSVYDNHGFFKPGWPRRPTTNELRGLVVSDIDNDGRAEIIVTGATYGKINTWVFENNGSLRPGWPQLGNSHGSAYGVFNDNAWAADMDDDGFKEIIVPSDVTTLCAYRPDGVQVDASPIYGSKKWGEIGTWESLSTELRGWGHCNGVRSESYRSNFAHGAAVVADVDGDGSREVVVTGNMYDCFSGYPPAEYTSLFIFNADRTRFKKGPWNWEQAPVNTGSPLSEDYHIIENCQPNPVVADIDGDHKKEILFAAYDGRMHAFWLDKTEHDHWPYAIYHSSEGIYRFASEPVIADLDRDGCSEVIFTSWVQKTGSGLHLGKLHILDCRGNVIHELALPRPKSHSRHENGALPAPTIANIDDDPDYELVINTINSGVVAYDLPGSAGAKIQWQSGRNRGGCLNCLNNNASIVPVLHLLFHP